MDEDFKEVQEKFQGLDMKTVIGDPLRAARDAEMMLASATTDFIEKSKLEPGERNHPQSTEDTDETKQKTE